MKVVGAAFRTANDAFWLVHIVKLLLCAWDGETPSDTPQSLDILVNNAAQPLTDPIKGEVKALVREDHLKDPSIDHGSTRRIREQQIHTLHRRRAGSNLDLTNYEQQSPVSD